MAYVRLNLYNRTPQTVEYAFLTNPNQAPTTWVAIPPGGMRVTYPYVGRDYIVYRYLGSSTMSRVILIQAYNDPVHWWKFVPLSVIPNLVGAPEYVGKDMRENYRYMQEYLYRDYNSYQPFCCPFMCPYLRYQRSNYRRQWYLHKIDDNFCEINTSEQWPDSVKTWGPFESKYEAVEKRVELAKQGICKLDKIPDFKFYVHKFDTGLCEENFLKQEDYQKELPHPQKIVQSWGPYDSEDEAIVKQYELYKQKICTKIPYLM
ncbi:hypothetical protein [Clostridium thailandense]|uniref:hypothetical protein n=1 Tax=Clostridium thailandense TaxID=2794346 RepID=UPI003989ECF9